MSKAKEILQMLQEGKIASIEVFSVRDRRSACKFVAKWEKKGYKVFNFDAGSDDDILVAAKSKPSTKDIAATAPPGQLKSGLEFDHEVDYSDFCD